VPALPDRYYVVHPEPKPLRLNTVSPMNTKLNQIQNWLELARDVKWSASALAKQCGVSVRTLERYFLKQLGNSPKAWLIEQRQRHVIKLLSEGNTVKETASCLHYKHQNHLTNDFKRRWGISPTDKATQTYDKDR
jgi:transcriptional regulator GlxA family with amidase domain